MGVRIYELEEATTIDTTKDLFALETQTGTKKIKASAVKTTMISGAELQSNRLTAFQATPDDQHYPSEKLVKDSLDDIREVAEGKTKTYIVSYASNPAFNSQSAEISVVGTITTTGGQTISAADLKLGDNVYVVETDVPDRWISREVTTAEPTTVKLNTLETVQESVTDVTVNGTSVLTNRVAVVTVPTKTSQLTNDSGFLTTHQSLAAYRKSADQDTIDAGKEDKTNKVTSISSSSTDTQYPSAKCLYNEVTTLTSTKQDKLPAVTNNRYLHTNASTGALEWSTVTASVAWGNITGTLSSQTDLQTVLNKKANITISATAPSSPALHDIWVDTSE